MAIFPNSEGLWQDTEKDDPEELSSYYASLVGPNAKMGFTTTEGTAKVLDNNSIATVLIAGQQERDRIDKQTEIFRPLTATNSGEDALTDLLGDRTQPKEVRAAAAQATMPGVKASIGAKGELSFSAAPGSDLGFNYPDKARKTTSQNNAGSAAQATVAVENFDKQVQALQSSADYAEVSSIYQSLLGSTTQFQAQKLATYQARVGQGLGMDGLEQQLQADQVLDKEYADKYMAGQYTGPSDESLANIQAYRGLRNERDQQVEELMNNDPELMMLKARMQNATTLVNQRLGETAVPSTGIIPTEDVNATIATMYGDPAKASPADRLRVSKELENMNPNSPAVQALDLARMDTQSQAMVATTGTGQRAIWASNNLKSKLRNPELVDQLKSEVAQFDSKYAPNLTEEQREELNVPITAVSGQAQQIAKEEIKAKKFAIVMQSINNNRRANFEKSIEQWDTPQDPMIRDEMAATIKIIKDQKIANKAVDPNVTIDEVIDRMDWQSGAADTAKIEAVTAYINSQAGNLDDTELFGPPAIYGNPTMTRSYVNGAVTRSRVNRIAIGRDGSPLGYRDLK